MDAVAPGTATAKRPDAPAELDSDLMQL